MFTDMFTAIETFNNVTWNDAKKCSSCKIVCVA